jgi:TonB family protein
MRKSYVLMSVLMFSYCLGVAGPATGQEASTESGRKVIRKVDPRYPEIAKKMNLGGTVKVIALVAPDGNVKKVEAMGGSPILVQAAQSAISQWKYVAGTESKELVELHFTPSP